MICVGAHPVRNKLWPIAYVSSFICDLGFVYSEARDEIEEIYENLSFFFILEGQYSNFVRFKVVELDNYVVRAILTRQMLQIYRLWIIVIFHGDSCLKVF